MKVLHIFGELKPSGGEAMMLSAAPSWLRESEMHILSTGEITGGYAEKLDAVGYQIHHIPFQKSIRFFIKIAKFLRKEQFDVVHLHTERASLWFALTSRIALGYTHFLVRTVHHIFKFNGWLKYRKKMERFTMRVLLNVTLISNSPSGKRNELKRFGCDNILIPNWYDDNVYSPPTDAKRAQNRGDLDYEESTCVFLSLGGNWYYKNYEMIVEALSLIPVEVKVLYVQVGVQGEGEPLESKAKRLGVTNRLHCTGVVVDPKIYLDAADVYMMPSSEEGFGVAAVEAMACGLPAILSDVEALCDFRENISNIEYIKPNPEEIAKAMVRLAELSNIERRRIGAEISNDTKGSYGLGRGAAGYLKLYKNFKYPT